MKKDEHVDSSDDESSSENECSESEEEEEEEDEEEEMLVESPKKRMRSEKKTEKGKKNLGKKEKNGKKVARRLNFVENEQHEIMDNSQEMIFVDEEGRIIKNLQDAMQDSQTLDGGPPYTQSTEKETDPTTPNTLPLNEEPPNAPKKGKKKGKAKEKDAETDVERYESVDVDLTTNSDNVPDKIVKIGNVKVAVGMRKGIDNNQPFSFAALTIIRRAKTGKDYYMSFPIGIIHNLIKALQILSESTPNSIGC